MTESEQYERKIARLERENRELRGELMALRHGIEGIIGKCDVVLGKASETWH